MIEAAGGIVQHRTSKKFLFIYRNQKWDIPKGRIEEGESVKSAAIREVEEETGVTDLTITHTLPTTFASISSQRKISLKKDLLVCDGNRF